MNIMRAILTRPILAIPCASAIIATKIRFAFSQMAGASINNLAALFAWNISTL